MPNKRTMSKSDIKKWNTEGIELPEDYKGKEFIDMFLSTYFPREPVGLRLYPREQSDILLVYYISWQYFRRARLNKDKNGLKSDITDNLDAEFEVSSMPKPKKKNDSGYTGEYLEVIKPFNYPLTKGSLGLEYNKFYLINPERKIRR